MLFSKYLRLSMYYLPFTIYFFGFRVSGWGLGVECKGKDLKERALIRRRPEWGEVREREFFIHSLLVRIHLIIVMIRWTGLAPWDKKIPFPGSLSSAFLVKRRTWKRVKGRTWKRGRSCAARIAPNAVRTPPAWASAFSYLSFMIIIFMIIIIIYYLLSLSFIIYVIIYYFACYYFMVCIAAPNGVRTPPVWGSGFRSGLKHAVQGWGLVLNTPFRVQVWS